MAAEKEYIKIEDIHNKLWKKRLNEPTILQVYIDAANVEIEDTAIRLNVEIADILDPIHSKLKEYAVNYALRLFAADNIGVNMKELSLGIDQYKDLFERSQYLIGFHKPELTYAVMTGDNQNSTTRAVSFGRTVR